MKFRNKQTKMNKLKEICEKLRYQLFTVFISIYRYKSSNGKLDL